MNNSKSLVITISISLLIVLVFGTSFAYFATNMSNIGVTNVQVNVAQSRTMITTNSTSCEIVVDEAMMTMGHQDLVNAINTSTCSLQIKLSGDQGIKCYYDVYLKEESVTNNENYTPYSPTPGIGTDYTYEFTGTINQVFSDNTGDNGNEAVSYYVNNSENIDALGHEIQMNTLTSGLLLDGTNNAANGLIARAVIAITQEDTDAIHTYNFIEKWYNIPKPQTTHANRKYIYKLSAENILC